MNITGAHIIIGHGPDHVSLITDKEPAIGWEQHSAETLHLKFEARARRGIFYVQSQFPGIPIEVLDLNDRTLTQYDDKGKSTTKSLK